MQLVAALFIENMEMRQVVGPSTRIDLTGVHFSTACEQFPTTITPHLWVLVRVPNDHHGTGALVVRFLRPGDDATAEPEEIARNRQVFTVDPGKFGYRLVRPELFFDAPGTIEAHCQIDGHPTELVVPLTTIHIGT